MRIMAFLVLALILAVASSLFDSLIGISRPKIHSPFLEKLIYMFFGAVIWELVRSLRQQKSIH